MVKFDEAHAAWLAQHLDSRQGERRGRLQRGHSHGEILFLKNVWYEVYGHLEHLHPEYEVLDWRGRSYFTDFAYLKGLIKMIIEIKGFAAHVRDMDRDKYCNELNRETFLTGMGFTVISFAYDDVAQRPDVCITLLRLVISQFQSDFSPVSRAVLAEKEIIRLAIQQVQPIRPIDVERHFEIDHRTAVIMLKKLCSKDWLLPVARGRSGRIVGYALARGVLEYLD
jgi:hypothetical protein